MTTATQPEEYKPIYPITTNADFDNLTNRLKNVLYKNGNPADNIINEDLKPDEVIIAKQQNGKYYKYGKIAYKDINKLLKYNNNLVEVCSSIRGKFAKHILDIDNKITVERNDEETIQQHTKKHDETIKMLVNDCIIFINDFANINIKIEDVLITTSTGYEDGKIILSNHIVFPIIFKWELTKIFSDILDDKIFYRYSLLYNTSYIDLNIYKVKNQNYRMLNQTKINSERVKTSTNSKNKPTDFLIMIYDENDISKYPNISDVINEYHTKYIQNIKQPHHKQPKTKKQITPYNPLNISNNILDFDKYSYLLYCIPNNINIIKRNEWFDIIILSFGYFYSSTFQSIKKNNSYSHSIYYNNLENHIKNVLYKWTNDGYIKKPIDYNTYTIETLKQTLKLKGISEYSNKSKKELVLLVSNLDIEDYTKNNNGDFETHKKNIDTIWEGLKNNKPNLIKYKNRIAKSFILIQDIAKEYNKDVLKSWDLHNNISSLIDLNNQSFYDKRNFPHYQDKTIYQQTINDKYIYLQAIMGMGKTDIIINILDQTKDKNILIISPRLTFSNATKSRYNNDFIKLKNKYNFNLYTDDKNIYANTQKIKRFIISPESIHKIDNNDVIYDIIILDELDTLCYSLSSDTCKQQGLYDIRINALYHHIKNSSKVIFAEAIPSIATVGFIKDLLKFEKIPKVVAFITEDIRFKQRYILKASYNSNKTDQVQDLFINDLIKDLQQNKNINAFVSSSKFLIKIKIELDKLKIRCVIIHADNKNEMKKYIENRGVLLQKEKIQFFGFTSTLSVGVSQESENYWNSKYIYYCNFGNISMGCISSSITLQAGYRCRYTLKTDKEQITNVYLQHINNNIHNISTNNKSIQIINDNTKEITKNSIDIFNKLLNKPNEDYYDSEDDECDNEKEINIKILEDLRYYNNKYNNGEIERSFINDEYYRYIDGDIIFNIKAKIFNQYSSAGLIFNENMSKLTRNLDNNISLMNAYDNKYFEDILKAKIKKQNNIWDDVNCIRSFKATPQEKANKKEMNDLNENLKNNNTPDIDKQTNNILNYTMEELHENAEIRNIYINDRCHLILPISRNQMKTFDFPNIIKDNDIHDKSFFDIYNTKNEYQDNEYNFDTKQLLINTYSIYTYIKGSSNINFYINNETTKLINALIEYYYYKNNHLTKNQIKNVELKYNTIKWLFDNIINEEQFKNDFTKCLISSLKIDELKDEITKIYFEYMTAFQLKSRREEKSISKVAFIINDIFGFNINIDVPRTKKTINGVRVNISNYNLTIKEKEYKTEQKQKEAEAKAFFNKLYFLTILNTFSYNKRIMKYNFINDDSETEEDNEDINNDINKNINDNNDDNINQTWRIQKPAIKDINKIKKKNSINQF
jgi:hypothetical protein